MDSREYFKSCPSLQLVSLKLNGCQNTTAITITWKNYFGKMAVLLPILGNSDRMPGKQPLNSLEIPGSRSQHSCDIKNLGSFPDL